MILIYYKTWIYQCLIIQVKSPSIYMVLCPGLGSDPSLGSGRESNTMIYVLIENGGQKYLMGLDPYVKIYNNTCM